MNNKPTSSGIVIENATVQLGGKNVLNDITVILPAGRTIGFIGPSGAGKTTFIRSIVGRQRLASGTILIDGVAAGSPVLRKRLSYMTQSVSVYGDLTTRENVRYFAAMTGARRNDARQMADSVLATVGLTPQSRQLASSLSGGQKQRLSLAIALLGDPEYLVLDEPTVGLDPVLREQLWKLFGELAQAGKTLIISSHAMDEASRCDDLVLIRDAQLLAHGSPEELCSRTHSKTVEESFLKLVKGDE